jgi:hypothetical protein
VLCLLCLLRLLVVFKLSYCCGAAFRFSSLKVSRFVVNVALLGAAVVKCAAGATTSAATGVTTTTNQSPT